MQIGYKLIAEAYSPQEMVRQAVLAEEAGFDFVEISDHFHPWFDGQGHSGFAWSILAAAAARTERIELATGVTCPFIRYHPAMIAQAAATTALLSEGRFTLGVGAGERLNEHVVGLTGWKVQAELPNPVNFEAATAFITEDDMRGVFGTGPDASVHLATAQQFVDAGYDHLALINAGPDPEGFFDFFASELAEPMRSLKPSG